MDAEQIKTVEDVRTWAMQTENKLQASLDQQCNTNVMLKKTLSDVSDDVKSMQRTINKWLGIGSVVGPVVLLVLAWALKEFWKG